VSRLEHLPGEGAVSPLFGLMGRNPANKRSALGFLALRLASPGENMSEDELPGIAPEMRLYSAGAAHVLPGLTRYRLSAVRNA